MAVEIDKNFKKIILDLENKISDEAFDELYDAMDDAFEEAASAEEAKSRVLQYIHEQPYYNKIIKTNAGQAVVDGLQKGNVTPTSPTIQATEKELGLPTDSDVMFNRFDEDDLVKLFGAKDKDDMLRWNYDKHWTRIPVGDIIELSNKAGLDYKAVIKSMAELQELHDREAITEGYDPTTGKVNIPAWLGSTYMGIMVPRTKEAIKMGKDPTLKDYALDVGSDVAQALPVGRAAGLVTKGAAAPIRGTAIVLGESAAVPFAETSADALAYDDTENPYRSRFDLGRAVEGSVINAATPYAIGAMLNNAKRLGYRGLGRKGEEILRGDPYLNALDKQADFENYVPSIEGGDLFQRAYDEAIMEDLLPDLLDNAKKAKLSAEKLKNYEDALQDVKGMKNLTAAKRDELLSKLKTGNAELDAKLEKIFNVTHPSYVTPTELIGDKAKKYGLTDEGNVSFYSPKASGSGSASITFLSPKEVELSAMKYNFPKKATQSAEDLAEAIKKEVEKSGGDINFQGRPSTFDHKIEKMMRDEDLVTRVLGKKPTYKLGEQGLITFTGNKLGRGSYANAIIAPDQVEFLSELTGLKKEVKDILSDPTIIRQWKAGFKPKDGNTAMNEAYNIFKKHEDEFNASQENAYSASTGKSSSSSYKKAGL